jgi:peptidoglycan-N-acetylglucosamine deacetylase
MTLFRPPYGHMDVVSRLAAGVLGYKVIGWSVVAEDWNADTSEVLASRVISRLQPGSIVLFHDALHTLALGACADRRPTLEAVRQVLDELRGLYEFVTIPELLRLGRQRKMGWFSQPDPAWLAQLRRREQPNEA